MAEYIERKKDIHAARYATPMMPSQSLAIVNAIESIPAADVRHVVLCRDCIYREPWYADKSRCFLWHESGIDVFNDGFCSYGKKREES